MFSTCDIRMVIADSHLSDKVQEAGKMSGTSPMIFSYGDGSPSSTKGLWPWDDLLRHGESDWRTLTAVEADKETAAYFSTSGTTGTPKYAAVSHSYLVTSGSNIEADLSRKTYTVNRLVSLPLMHAFAAPLAIVGALRCGTPTYLMARFSEEAFLDALAKFEITDIPVVPSMLSALLAASALKVDKLSSLREVMSAGAPLSQSLAVRFKSLLPHRARLIQLYGLTEAGWVASVPYQETRSAESPGSHADCPASEEPDYSDSEISTASSHTSSPPDTPLTSTSGLLNDSIPTVGSPLSGFGLRLADVNTKEIIAATRTLGEILIEAPHPFLYYLGAPEATSEAFLDVPVQGVHGQSTRSLLRSGDIAYFDEQGDYFIVDRLKDLIKVRGWQVSPAELEDVLLHHPGVADAAVVGLPADDGLSGELPYAFVVRAVKNSLAADATAEELKDWLKDRLAAYKRLASVRFIERVPRNPAGKALRRILRDCSCV